MKVVSIEEGFKPAFWNHANQDPLDYYFILDLEQRPEQTKVLLALEEKKVEGMMLVYADRIVQLRGNQKAVELLLDSVNLEKVELQAPLDCEDIVLTKYTPKVTHELMLMSLRKGEENIQIRHKPARLQDSDAAQIAEIMKKADPEWWGEATAELQKESLKNAYWLGVKREGRLVSVGSTRFADFGSNIGVVATDEQHRNMGFATSIVSALVQEILKKSAVALIHVLKNNAPAVRVYSKVGFKPHKHYLLLRAEKVKR